MNAQPLTNPPQLAKSLNTTNGPSCLDERRIFWIHGLGGDAQSSWQKAGSDIQSRYCVRNNFPEYTAKGLLEAGQNVLNHIKDAPPTGSVKEPFAICHSQGGLVARSATYQAEVVNKEPNPIQGIVTFGTPHQGAKILDHIDDIVSLIDEGCFELAAGPITEIVESNFWLDLIFDAKDVLKNITPKICSTAGGIAKSNFADFQTTISKDYRFNQPSEYFIQIKNYESPIHKVAFYGIEDDPVLFRTMDWLITSPEDVPLYSANQDDKVLNSINKLTNDYYLNAKKNYELEEYYDKARNNSLYHLPISIVHYFIYRNKRNEHKAIGDSYIRGYNWLNSMNDKWKSIIGAGEYYEIPSYHNCTCYEYDASGQLINVNIQQCYDPIICETTNGWWESCFCDETINLEYRDIEPSDGVTPQSSAEGFPGVDKNNIKEMVGSNHQQMRNDRNTKSRLEELMFDGTYGLFFKTTKKY